MRRGIAVAAAVLVVLGSGALAAGQDGNDTYDDYDGNDSYEEYDGSGYDGDAQPRPNSSFEREGDAFVGDHVAFTLDEDRPGVTGYRILDGNVTVFRSVTLPGNETRWSTFDDRFVLETSQADLMIRDHESYRIGTDVDAHNDGDEPSTQTVPTVRLTVAEGVDVSENETWSDESDPVYDLSAGEHDLRIGGEELSYRNGTFRALDDVMVGADYPPQGDAPEHRPYEDRRERESQWTRDGDDFQGDHVRFTKDEALPGVADVGPVDPDLTVLAGIALPGEGDADWRAHGRIFAMQTDAAELRVVDVPPAVMNLEVRGNGSATITLADGVTAEEVPVEDEDAPENASMYELHLPGNRTGWLGATDAHIVHADTTNGSHEEIEVRGMAMARLAPGDDPRPGGPDEEPEHDDPDRRGPPEDAPAAAQLDVEARQKVDRAAATGKVGVEVHPGQGEATAVEMGHVAVREAHGPEDDVKAGVTVEAPDDAPGTVVRFALNASALEGVDMAEAADVLTVRYDNETIEAADDLDDVLDWSDDGGEPEYLLLVGGEEVEVLVSVPHFSPHTIEVVETASSGDEAVDGTPGPGAVAAVAAGLAAAAARRR